MQCIVKNLEKCGAMSAVGTSANGAISNGHCSGDISTVTSLGTSFRMSWRRHSAGVRRGQAVEVLP